MARQPAGTKGSPKKSSSLNLVTEFFHYLREEQEAVQKRTFTKWINSHLAKCQPPLVVTDLFEDIKDGVILLALLEVLSGQSLPCEQGKKLRRIHWVANIGTALNFLEGRKCLCDLLAVVVLPASVLQRPLAPRTIEDMLETGLNEGKRGTAETNSSSN
ncbi:unnamed protein product [Arctogadus glacialis]